ncbi:MAG TPA: DUF1015 family protein [Immundisolibacter sp.]
MPLIRPFRGLRPAPGRAGQIIAPPYDVMNTAEARAMVEGRPLSFLHVSRPEVDLPPDTDPYADAVYAKGAENLRRMLADGVRRQDDAPCYYAYRLVMDGRAQLGLVLAASVRAYDENRIRRHEFTRPDKEIDRVRHIDTSNSQTGPVFRVHRAAPALDGVLERASQGQPAADVVADGGVRHTLWVIDAAADIAAISLAVEAAGVLYIADGHHRSAAASRVAAQRGGPADAEHWYFLAVSFPHDQVKILDYNRLLTDLNDLDETTFKARVAEHFEIEPVPGEARPMAINTFGMYLAGQWYRLRLKPGRVPADPVGRLDVSLLHQYLIEPILGVSDPRRDKRIDFVGGIRGLGELQRRVDSGEMAVAFALYATSLEDLMAVADAGQVMPPKSTWFEPKLADGMVSHLLG